MRCSKHFIAIISAVIFVFVGTLLLRCSSKNVNSLPEKLPDTTVLQQLGRYLFYDRRLSVNSTRACATCHNPDFAFTDGYKRSTGAFADLHQRNSLPLFNLQYYKYFTAADSSLHSLQQQMEQPMFNKHPVEMGIADNEEEILSAIKKDQRYQNLFAQVFKDGDNAIQWSNIKTAIASFIASIQSADAPYDRFLKGESNAISARQKRGMELFFSAKFNCASCHGGFNFSNPSVTDAAGSKEYYFNTGLYNLNDSGNYPGYDQGLYQYTHNRKDMGKYRVPTLRNLAFTGPYFHDGSAATVSDAVAVFLNGGRNITAGIYAGDGTKNIYRHPSLKHINATMDERLALVDFLYSLSDSGFIQKPAFRNPFTTDETKKK